jgi:CRISPR-associated endonuclease Csn1
MKNYRLGIDLGATSLGWSLLELDNNNEPVKLEKVGVRIFPDGRNAKTNKPLNVKRREHRSMRRNRDRYLQRRKYLLDRLIRYGLMPENENERKQLQLLDPYLFRKKALDEKISLFELGRVIFHLNQRRGFKSNRKFDNDEKEKSKMKDAINKVKHELETAGASTLGEYLYNLNKDKSTKEQVHRIPIRIRDHGKEYNLYTERTMYENEFEKIWNKQKQYHSELTNDVKEHLHKIIFTQRNLKKQPKGKCRFEKGEFRCPIAFPIVQKFRIYQEVNNLILLDFDRYEHELTIEQRETIKRALLTHSTATLKGLRQKLGKEYKDYVFNMETEKRSKINCDETASIMRKKEYFGEKWDKFKDEEQDEIIFRLVNEDNIMEIENTLVNWLCETFEFNEDTAERIKNIRLPQGTSNLSKKAINKILPYLKKGFNYYDSKIKAGYTERKTGEIFDEGNLPYYGEIMEHHTSFGNKEKYTKDEPELYYGKIGNPTVHIALNQLRKFINALTKKYGAPTQIVIELARELPLGKESLSDLIKGQRENEQNNERIKEELEKIGLENTYQNRLKYKLWEELDKDPTKRCCPYTGRTILLNAVDGLYSNKFEIEHILPKSKTFNDRPSNKTISYYKANRFKGEQSPFEAFGGSLEDYNWDNILERGLKLPKNKRWRFHPDAMKNFQDEGELISRMLTDTQYMSRVALEYMSYVCGAKNVWAIPGQLTGKIRTKWGLNKLLSEDGRKNREDNRHHAIDAFVVACTDKAMLQKVTTAIKQSKKRFIEKIPQPFANFTHEDIQEKVDNIIVSYKPDHGNTKAAITDDKQKGKRKTIYQLHDETAYGFVSEDIEHGKITLSVRKPLISLDSEKNIKKIVSTTIRNDLLNLIDGKPKKEIKNIVTHYSEKYGINRVKIRDEKDKKTVIPIYNKKGEIYKYYLSGSNYCADIYCSNKGDKAGKWQVDIIPMFKAHQSDFEPEWHKQNPTAKKIMRFFINDFVAYDEDGERKIRRVKKMNVDGRMFFIDPKIAKSDKEPNATSVKQLQERNARKIGIDILGKVYDSKPQDENN